VLLVCVQVLHEKLTLVAHWLACAGSVTHDDDNKQTNKLRSSLTCSQAQASTCHCHQAVLQTPDAPH
jgi:hypothetical protein